MLWVAAMSTLGLADMVCSGGFRAVRLPGASDTRIGVGYVTAEFPHKAISTIDQNFLWAMPGFAQVWNRQ